VEVYKRNAEFANLFAHLEELPTYSVSRAPKICDVKRALRLSGMLVLDGVDKNADDEMRDVLIKKLRELRDLYAKQDSGWGSIVREKGEIEVDVTMVAIGPMSVAGKKEMRMTLTEENIDQLFDAAGRKLAAGEGLHRSYWKRYHQHDKPNETKLELFAIVRQPGTIAEMEKLALSEFNALWQKHKASVRNLPAADRARFDALLQAGGKPVQREWEFPEQIVERKEGEAWKSHLYCNAAGEFFAKLNSWENDLLEAAMQEKEFVAWLRNTSRRDWSLCVPYELGGTKSFYPDFIVIRRNGTAFEVDILEPHDHTRADTWAKAKGLATFADQHGIEFGRLIIARKKGNEFQKLDLNDKTTRHKARGMQSQNDLESLFGV
jgi:type III restriction enzyme